MSRYGKITGSKKISEDYQNINLALDNVEADVDAKAAIVTGHIGNANIHVTAAQKQTWDAKADGSTATELADHMNDQTVHVTQADHDKLDGIEPGAQVNQPAFSRVNDIQASDPESQFYIVGGLGITVTTNPTTGQVTVTATGDAAPGEHGITHTEFGADPIPAATATEGGIMSAAQAAELIAHGVLLQQHDTAITSLTDRLDTAGTDDVVLQPGLQVIDAAKDARFKPGQIEGKTEINYEGRTGLIGVESPYVINTSGNLLPPFYEWRNGRPDNAHVSDAISIPDPYTITLTSTAQALVSCEVKLVPNNTYVFDAESFEEVAHWYVYKLGDYATVIADGISPFTFTPGETDYVIGLYKAIPGAVTFKNPMLTIGTEPQPFMPQHKSMLAFQTELHANPTDGTEPDILFEQHGEYKKLAKWKKVVLDGSHGWLYSGASYPGYKRVSAFFYGAANTSQTLMKYNGTTVPRFVTPWGDAEEFNLASNGEFLLTISNTDSGWGDGYTPTADEFKAYFSGWTMAHLDGTVPYEPDNVGVHGAKVWIPTLGFNGANGSTTIQFSPSPYAIAAGWSPYNLLYRLAKETVEPVVTEGSLLLSEGDNMVEVGAGIVLRERANPYYHASQNRYYINNLNFGTSLLNFKSSSIIAVYKDSTDDATWHVDATPGGGANLVQAYVDTWNYDQAASYSVTYTKLDKSPIQPISGSLAANEKAQISDLTAGVAEALHGVSVLAMKKAEKDAPGWITPTLLNGAVQGSTPVRYKKMSDGTVNIIGIFTVVAPGNIFKLLPEYRPKDILRQPIVSFNSDGSVYPSYAYIEPSGNVNIGLVGNNYTSFDGVIFLAEQ